MNEVKLLIQLAQKVRTIRDAILLMVLAAIFITILYLIPEDVFESN